MNKEEDIKFLKIQTSVLKVNIHCDGCKQKVKKILQKIDGVYTITIGAEQGKVTVTGNVNPDVLVRRLVKAGKHAEILAPNPWNNNINMQLNHQFQKMQLDNNKIQKDQQMMKMLKDFSVGKDQKPCFPLQLQQQLQQQQQFLLQQQQQMKVLKDLNQTQFKEPKLPFKNPKSVKFAVEADDDFSDEDGFDDEFDEGEFDVEYNDDFDDVSDKFINEKGMINAHQQPINKTAMTDKNAGCHWKKNGGDFEIPVHIKGVNIHSNSKNGHLGKKGSKEPPKRPGKNGGEHKDHKKVNNGSKGGKKNSANEASTGNMTASSNFGKKGEDITVANGMNPMTKGFRDVEIAGGRGPPMSVTGGGIVGAVPPMGFTCGTTGAAHMTPIGNISMGQMGNMPAVQGLPAVNPRSQVHGAAGSEVLTAGNNQYQQYLAAMSMNQQKQNVGNERIQTMMYARPPSTIAYYPTPPAPVMPEPYTYFSDDNPNSCSLM